MELRDDAEERRMLKEGCGRGIRGWWDEKVVVRLKVGIGAARIGGSA
jgi:hypothetical protein